MRYNEQHDPQHAIEQPALYSGWGISPTCRPCPPVFHRIRLDSGLPRGQARTPERRTPPEKGRFGYLKAQIRNNGRPVTRAPVRQVEQ